MLERMFTKFSEITQCNGHYVVQGHSKSPILVSIKSSYDFRVSTTPGNTGNTGNLLEFEIPPGNTGNLLDFC